MWMVVQSLKDNSIKYVPKTWYNKKKQMCAWPIAKNYSKRLIEKMTPLHLFEYYWLPVKKIGRLYGSLEEARTKMYYAKILTTISINREHTSTNMANIKSENKEIQSTATVKTSIPKQEQQTIHDNNSTSSVIRVKDKKKDKYGIPKQDQQIEHNNKSTSTTTIRTKDNTKDNSGIPKQEQQTKHDNNSTSSVIRVKDKKKDKYGIPKQDQQIEHNYKSISTTIIRTKDNTKDNSGIPKQDQQIEHNNKSTSTTTIRTKDNTKDNSDFQNQVLSLLTKMNDEISNLKSSLNIQNDTIKGFDTFLKNTIGQTIGSQISNKSSITFDDIFPLKYETELETFEEKIKGDKIFRNDVISSLSMLNNMNSIGNSVKCIMTKMFSDELASHYSLSGAKQKKNFSNLPTYCLLIDAIQYNHGKIDNEKIDAPLAIWLSLAKFRIEQTKRKLI